MGDTAIHKVNISLPLEEADDEAKWRKAVARKLGVELSRIGEIRLLKRSIDARRKIIKIGLSLEASLDGSLPPEPKLEPNFPKVPRNAKTLVIVGCGPAGMFAALKAIELGWKPIILERGKDASRRRFDLAPILREGRVIEDSNYCFGEGGAGTFSDGKLYTRATKRGSVRYVYETLVAHGAPRQILTEAHPHIGSNLLPNVVKAMRQSILDARGEVHFESRVSRLLRSPNGSNLKGVATVSGDEYIGDAVVLATGHSARDIFKLLHAENLLLEPKTFAMGVRIEHPQPLIDSIQYHLSRDAERPRVLPAASYQLATTIENRGVYSFCMCPGGFIVPAATENDEVVVNGMSLARRDSPFANSGLVVTIESSDTEKLAKEHGVLAGIAYQKSLEQIASRTGGGKQKAPAQRVVDFLENRLSPDLPKTSYFPGISSAPLHELLPSSIADRMKAGLLHFGKTMPDYIANEACLIGFETRTSSPIRIPREEASLQHPQLKGLFPCGEGAGYAGGIVSAALDGLRCAEAACEGE